MTEPVNSRLRALRLSANPPLSIRAMAQALDMPPSSYNYFEDRDRFKKRQLPLDFARRVAGILAQYDVDPAKVLALAGLTDGEAAPEAGAIIDRVPSIRFVQMAVAMPSEAAMTDMFETLLRAFGDGLPRAELARRLARRLPVALAQLQAPLVETNPETETLPDAAAPDPATDRRAPQSQPRK